MAKNVMQDVIPKEKRSIRNIPIPGSTKRPRIAAKPKDEEPMEEAPRRTHKIPPPRSPKSNKKLWFFGLTIFILFVIGGIMTVFGKTTIVITPKTAQAAISQTVTASTDSSTGVLFQMVELEDTLTKQVPATDAAYVEEKAHGTIIVYNNYDDKDQRLITNTRFESEDGKIYRIRESIVVPGKEGNTPGSVEAEVYADEVGESYNVSNAKFTIPGFKGDPRFDGFYAETKSSISGGFVGERQQIAEGVMSEARRELDTTLRANLLGAIRAQVPENLVVLEDLVTLTYEDIPQKDNGTMTTIGRKGKIMAPLIHNENLAKVLAQGSNTPAEVPFYIPSFDGVNVVPTDSDASDGQISFEINGPITFVASLDNEKIQHALANKAKTELTTVLSQFPSIASAEASISPFWVTSFPKEGKDIIIVVNK